MLMNRFPRHRLSPVLGPWRSFAGVALVFLFARTDLHAQQLAPAAEGVPEIDLDIPLQKLREISVESAAKRPQTTAEAPSAVTVITGDEIKRYGYRTLADILQSAPGLYVSYDRSYSFLGIRGINRGDNNSRVLLMVDGHRVNNPLTDGAFIGTDFVLDVDLIDQVEIVRGPGAILYGNNAFFGVINVKTRKGQADGIGGEVSAEVASFDTYKGRVTYSHLFKNQIELLLSGTLYDSEGAKDLHFQNRAASVLGGPNEFVAHQGDDENLKEFFGRLAYRDLTLSGSFMTREKGDPTAPDLTAFGDPRTRTFDERSYVNLKFTHTFPEVVDVTAQVYYDSYAPVFERFYDIPSPVVNQETRLGEWIGAEVLFNKEFDKGFLDKLKLTLGAEYRNEFREYRRYLDLTPGAMPFEIEGNSDNYGVFLQGEYPILKNLHLNAGARYDQYGSFDPTANPRVALIYQPVPKSTLKAIYGTAFRAPNFFERSLVNPQAPNLRPETITSYELVYEQELGRVLRSSLSGFYNQIDDLITVPLGGYAQNLEGADARGIVVGLEGLWKSGLRGRASYSFQETKDRATDQVLTDSPKHLAKFDLSVPVLKDKVFASLEFLYTSRRTTSPRTTLLGTTLLGTDAAGFGIFNLTLFSQKLVKGLDFSASVYNLLDKRYSDPASVIPYHVEDLIERDGRTFRVKMTYRF
jgi:outer membrane receptor for ferrienterochelin and colicins